MIPADLATWRHLCACLGDRLVRVARIHFCYGSECDREDGKLELEFRLAGTLTLQSGGGGDYLIVANGEWCDPFSGWIQDQIDKLISEFGAYRRFDLANDEGFSGALAREFDAAQPIMSRIGRLIGAELSIGRVIITMYCGADEEHVALGTRRAALSQMGATVGEHKC